ncbi:MAG: cell division protein FtsA [Firmicutes bacterium]|nr:cell division protein FtsA [Bacillota bacterium]
MSEDILFALDIGTRTVVGLLCKVASGGVLRVEAHHVEAHPQRAMLDGQIHDVAEVSTVIRRVKEQLEAAAGCTLERASIAAAGRALSTLRADSTLKFDATREITREDLRNLEMQGLAVAKEKVSGQSENLYCVGYSPVAYTLNQQLIANPVGQKGSEVGVELIATFLPQVVVDSLFSALAKAGLAVGSLTLEPIAAMTVAIPPRLRMLNLALVDVGAGTSDIAISREGTIFAYAMVDKAGDEVTEALAQHYLLDFNTAESVKLALGEREELEFTDVLGNRYHLAREDIHKVIEPVVDELAAAIARTIKEHNGGVAPAAVFCVGGGSQTPLLREYLSIHLDIPQERTGIRRREALDNIEFDSPDLAGPEVVTPLGIALTALRPQGEHFIQVQVNGDSVTLFNVQQSNVAQALLHSGMDLAELLGARGQPLEFNFNGQIRRIPGQPGVPGRVRINGQPATLESSIGPGDSIEVSVGSRGDDAKCNLEDLAEAGCTLDLVVNGELVSVPEMRLINDLPASGDSEIGPGDAVEIRLPATVAELAALMDVDIEQFAITINGQLAGGESPVSSGQSIEFVQRELADAPVAASGASSDSAGLSVSVNGRNVTLPPGQNQLMHALAAADIDCSSARGRLIISVNGREAEFTTELADGDRIEVFWTAM